ncbi:MAG: hypothetical protein IJS47_00030 [Clostridia bacterium]|nr:hypothetical protein [Clostridia bacterium]
MMKNKALKKGGIDTILAYIVVAVPLFYVLVFMITTLYHFSIQMHLNQTLKETLILASSYGTLTNGMMDYLCENIASLPESDWDIRIAVRRLTDEGNDFYTASDYTTTMEVRDKYDMDYDNVSDIIDNHFNNSTNPELKKGDLLAIEIISQHDALLGKISEFSIFGGSTGSSLKYSAYREEIIANDHP